MEEGLAEDEAVAEVGSVADIAAQIIAEIPLAKITIDKIKPKKRLGAGTIVLLVLGSPIWLSLLIAAFAVVLSLYAALWAVIVSVWAVFASLAASFVGGVAAGCLFIVNGSVASGLAVLAACFVCAGLAIFTFYGCKAVTLGAVRLTRKAAVWIKKCFIKREGE
jgi:uncharacterized membrane protein